MTRAPQFFTVPPGTKASQCRSCRATIYWIELPSGKRMPVDCDVDGGQKPDASSLTPDGTGVSHFATCPDAARFRRPR